MAHVYYGVEAMNITVPQRNTIVAAIQAIPPMMNGMPARHNHWRVRSDNWAAIFEAYWNDADMTINAFKTRIADALGIDPATVTHSVTSTAYGPLVTFTRAGQTRLRVIQFGGASPTWAESSAAARQYIQDNAAEWEGE
jgi:hypothetical protein